MTADQISAADFVEHVSGCACAACARDRDVAGETGGSVVNAATGNLGTLDALADFLMTGFWNTGYGDGSRSHNVTGSGIDANNGVLHYNVSGYWDDADGLTDGRADLVREAFKLFEATLGISFVETTSTDGSVVDFFFRDNDGGAYAGSGYWNSGAWGSTISYARINVAESWYGGRNGYDNYALQTILHEIGHALGLGHQGSYNGSATYGQDNTFDNDSWQATMMSYFSQTEAEAVNASYEFLQTPMAVDWLALDVLYGRQGYGTSRAFTEDTVWGFNTTIGSDVSDIWATWSDWGHRTASTIVDGDGIDTLDLSGYSNNSVINLAASDGQSTSPAVSDIGGRTGNLTIASGTVIENAIGGAGGETFYGNSAENAFDGGGGSDTFHDSAGSDTYDGGTGTDTVTFDGDYADYEYGLVAGFLQVVDVAIDWVKDTVEWLAFRDQTLGWQAVADSVVADLAPDAADDSFAVQEGAVLAGDGLLDNDSDPEGSALTIGTVNGVAVSTGGTEITLASGAIVTMNRDGTFSYQQNDAFYHLAAGEQGTDTFTYRASDGAQLSGLATVTVQIAGKDPVPMDPIGFEAGTQTSVGGVVESGFEFVGGALTADPMGGAQLQSLGNALQLAHTDGGLFRFDDATVTTGGTGDEMVLVEGFVDGRLVALAEFNVQANTETQISTIDPAFDGVDELIISATNGVTLDDLNFWV